MNAALCLLTLAALSLSTSALARDVYVAPSGNDRNPGTKTKPLASLEAAQALARKQKSPTVWLATGQYELRSPLVLDARDSRTTWRAALGANVSLLGGKSIAPSHLTPVTDPQIRKRLTPAAAQSVVKVDLVALGIRDFGQHKQFGHSIAVSPAPLEVFFNHEPLTLARYPNTGSLLLGKIIDPGSVPRTGDYTERGGTFTYTDPRHASWVGQRDIWLQGTFNYGFADDYLRVESIDPEKKQVKLVQPHLYGLGAGQPYQQYVAHNILEELDSPGEWYLDRAAGALYLWPPAPLKGATLQVSLLEEPVLCLENARNVTMRDLTVEVSRGIGIYLEGGSQNKIIGCTVRNVGTSGIFMGQGAHQTFPHVTVDDYTGVPVSRQVGNLQGHLYNNTVWERHAGDHQTIQGCEVYNTGSGGIVLSGGSKKQLTRGNNTVERCRIHDYNRRNKFLWAGINVDGCGNRVAHCELYNSDYQGIYVHGNEHVFEFNEVHHVTRNSNDTSPWYLGRDPSDRGNIVRYNYFHHCGNPARMTMGIYCDDSTTGVQVYGNVFYQMQMTHGVLFSNTGWDLTMTGNIIIEPLAATAEISAHYYTWAAAEAPQMFGEKGLLRKRLLESVNILAPPYSTRYPELKTYLDPIIPGKEWEGMRARGNRLAGNLIVGGPADPVSLLGGKYAQLVSENNWVTMTDPGFVDYKNKDFRLRPDSDVFQKIRGFVAPPFAKMGLRVDK
jgi:parallel beta-helix repeat protein